MQTLQEELKKKKKNQLELRRYLQEKALLEKQLSEPAQPVGKEKDRS